ncbi:MAG: hypothetical protein MUF34_20110 [Polyangiaceae bacterium]|jgi:hypothetical protein|nr:hypothetical protein [Polyangiaceae bacterium]
MSRATVCLALLLASTAANAAPMGPGVEPVQVLGLDDDDTDLDTASKAMTNALRQRVLDAPEYTLGGQSPPAVSEARGAHCDIRPLRHATVEAYAKVFDVPCLRRLAPYLGVKRFFWGFLVAEAGRPVVHLHFWDGAVDRSASLPYEPGARDRIAERLYRKLVTPDTVGDVTISGTAEGELMVDDTAAGTYAPGLELTLSAGAHALEVRQGPRVVARGRAQVEARGRVTAQLEPVAQAALAPVAPWTESPRVVVRPRASAWPWVLGGATAAGLAGAGVFWGLRAGERAELERACDGHRCPPGLEGAADRADRYRTWAGVSLGVGVAAGAGLGAYLLTRRAPPRVLGGVVPLAGGAAATVAGSF